MPAFFLPLERFFDRRSRQHRTQLFLSVFIIVTIITTLVGQFPLVRAQVADSAVASVGLPVQAPFGLQVNTLDGSLTYTRTDLHIRGGQYPLTLDLLYRTRIDPNPRAIAQGWTTNHHIFYETIENGDIRVYMGDGSVLTFLNRGERYEPFGFSGMQWLPFDGGYLLTDLDGTRWFFTDPNHTSITRLDRAGTFPFTYAYDEAGLLQSVTNQFGASLFFLYDTADRLIAVEDFETSKQVALLQNAQNQLISVTDVTGEATRFVYDDEGQMIRLIDPRNASASIAYADGDVASVTTDETALNFAYDNFTGTTNVTQSVDGEERVTIYDYNAQDQIESVTTPGECRTELAWNEDGNIQTFTNPAGMEMNYLYDDFGNLQVAEGGGMSQVLILEPYYVDDIEYRRVVNHIVIPEQGLDYYETIEFEPRAIQRLQYNVRYEYVNDPLRPSVIEEPDNATEQYNFDEQGNLVEIIDALGNSTTIVVDERGDIISFTNGAGDTFQLEYDSAGNVIREIDPEGNVVARTFDEAGRVTSLTYPDGATERYEYDALGNMTVYTDTAGNITLYDYDDLNRLTRVIDATGNSISYTYNEQGFVTTHTDALGNVTTYEYDNEGNPIREISPDGSVIAQEYDCMGNVTVMTMPDGNTITYEYNMMGKLARTAFPDGTEETKSYDYLGNLIQHTDASGTTDVVVNGNNIPISVTDGFGNTVTYEYDQAFNRTAMIYPDGTRYEYTYDALQRMTSVTGPEGTTTYTYRYDSRPDTITRPNGLITTYTYNQNGFATQVKHQLGDNVLLQYDYTYNTQGFVAQEALSGSEAVALTTDYDYDALGQLISSVHSDGTFSRYTYDGQGNRLTMETEQGATSYIYNERNQLLQETAPDGLATLYRYDSAGNLTERTGFDGTTRYTYDADGRLVGVDDGDILTEYVYNTLDERVATITNDVQVNHILDAQHPLTQTIALQDEGGFTNFTWGMGQISERASDGTMSYYLGDVRFSTIAVADESANIVQTLTYGDFGELEGVQVPDALLPHFTYTGEEYDANHDLLYLRARFYSPDEGRFISEDLFRGYRDDGISQNQYIYTFNNPVNYVDPIRLVSRRWLGWFIAQSLRCFHDGASRYWVGGFRFYPHDSIRHLHGAFGLIWLCRQFDES
jgi:RHS repeat-associated protein